MIPLKQKTGAAVVADFRVLLTVVKHLRKSGLIKAEFYHKDVKSLLASKSCFLVFYWKWRKIQCCWEIKQDY